MKQRRIPAAFIRGGTSNAIVFNQRDLPDDRALWDRIFLAAMGTPDPYGRQLNGMGGGISSLSKVCIVGPPTHEDADIDYTFAQIGVERATVSYAGNCGNMSAAMGPFAIDEGIVSTDGDAAMVRIHNTNTKKIIHAHFAMDEGRAAVDGDYELRGVAGTGAPVRLDFRDPGGAGTGKLLPTGNVIDTLVVPELGEIEVSMVDAGNPVVFVAAQTLGLKGTELPADIDANGPLMATLEQIRAIGAVAMGLAETPEQATKSSPVVPFVGFVSPAQDAVTIADTPVDADEGDVTARILSSGKTHRALPLTCSICTTVAARIDGTLVNRLARPTDNPTDDLNIMQPSGILTVASNVYMKGNAWYAEYGSTYRTQRRLFDGFVYVPASQVPELAADGKVAA
ncbi:MAG: 2-methylaconitate cis-trans isomerase PrpF family protein [Alphaproteobacteria bacterium]|nr:2-methylaconitate cis-trans isomerase PrpF family protein [Alphaproteobacteria bacterium]